MDREFVPPTPRPESRPRPSAADAFLDRAKEALEALDNRNLTPGSGTHEGQCAEIQALALTSIAASLIAITDKMYE